jgi:phosphoribosylanthranilate isomerase
MSRTRVKICGITRPQDAQSAVASGADAIGLVFYRDSPRHVSLQQARLVVDAVAPFVTVVGLFVNESSARIAQVLEKLPLDLLQFHGQEPNDACKSFGLPFIKSIAMHPETDLRRATADPWRWRRVVRLAAGAAGPACTDYPCGWSDSGQRRCGDPPGSPVRGGCQQRRGDRQGH